MDGKIDDGKVAMHLEQNGATMIMFASEAEWEASDFDHGAITNHAQYLMGHETAKFRYKAGVVVGDDNGLARGGPCPYKKDLICDASLEEIFHIITTAGYGYAYPKIFGEYPGSAIAIAMDHSIADCGFASKQTPLGEYTHFKGQNCTGVFHYSDATCDYGCLLTEYLFHVVSTFNGFHPYNGCPVSPHEWTVCRRGDLLESRILLQHQASEAWHIALDTKFSLPRRMPTGRYLPTTTVAPVTFAASTAASNFTQAPLELREFAVRLPNNLRQRYSRQDSANVKGEFKATLRHEPVFRKGG